MTQVMQSEEDEIVGKHREGARKTKPGEGDEQRSETWTNWLLWVEGGREGGGDYIEDEFNERRLLPRLCALVF